MLARSVVVRLAAADVPKTSTHDLLRASRLAQRALLPHNGFIASFAALRSRAYRAALLKYRRSYATEARATKPTSKVKSDVKKAAAAKPAKKTTTKKTPSKPSSKSAVRKQAKPRKTKKKAVKPKPRPKRVAKKPTAEQKEKARIRDYKKQALKPPNLPHGTITAWMALTAESTRAQSDPSGGFSVTKAATDNATKYKNLTPAEREHYNHLAKEMTDARRAEYTTWLHQHTPEQIRLANVARSYLQRKLVSQGKRKSGRWAKLVDDRAPKGPRYSYAIFYSERIKSGDFKSIPLMESSKLVAEEWKSLSAGEKKKYEDEAKAGRAEYLRKYEQVYGHPPSARSVSPSPPN